MEELEVFFSRRAGKESLTRLDYARVLVAFVFSNMNNLQLYYHISTHVYYLFMYRSIHPYIHSLYRKRKMDRFIHLHHIPHTSVIVGTKKSYILYIGPSFINIKLRI